MMVPTNFDNCRPCTDVLAGAVKEADFAVGLAQMIVDDGSAEHLEPAHFFANTYPTRCLKYLLANVCGRLSGAGGEAASMFCLDTSYGGGKSRGLIAPCHAARSGVDLPGTGEFLDPALLPERRVRIAAFDGENADPAHGRRIEAGHLAFSHDNMRSVAQGIEAMGLEEAAYWLAMAMHRKKSRRVVTTLRTLLTELKSRGSRS